MFQLHALIFRPAVAPNEYNFKNQRGPLQGRSDAEFVDAAQTSVLLCSESGLYWTMGLHRYESK